MEGHIGDRLQVTAERISGLRTDLEDECRLRDSLVLEAVDSGISQGNVARWARLSETRVRQVIVEQTLLQAS
jgi:hypothetical protein